MSAWPKECPVFAVKGGNEHWQNSVCELTEVNRTGPYLDYALWHYCEFPHFGWVWSLDALVPLTPAAREMLAIARGAK